MTLAYSFSFVTIWLVGLLGLLLLFPLGVWFFLSTAFNGVDYPLLAAFIVCTILALFGAWTRFWPTIKHLVRTGVLFEGVFTDRFPTTEAELITHALSAYDRGNKSLTTVSHGWSFYLKKQAARGPRVWTTRFTGPVDTDDHLDNVPLHWKSGTTLVEVKKKFKAVGKTVVDTPSMEWLSLGSWIASCSHGHPGTLSLGTSPLHWLESARVLDCSTSVVSIDDESVLLAKFLSKQTSQISKSSQYVILSVKFKADAVVPNTLVARKGTDVKDVTDVDRWLRGEFIRLIFVSRHKKSLGVVWSRPVGEPVITDEKHMHPHTCSTVCFHCHSDVDAAVPWGGLCGFGATRHNYGGFAELDHAYASISPTFFPFQTILPQIFTVYNLELFLPILPRNRNSRLLFSLIKRLEGFHFENGGRTELRLASDASVLFLDLSTQNLNAIDVYFRLLKAIGLDRGAQHPGKFILASGIAPLREISVASAFRSIANRLDAV